MNRPSNWSSRFQRAWAERLAQDKLQRPLLPPGTQEQAELGIHLSLSSLGMSRLANRLTWQLQAFDVACGSPGPRDHGGVCLVVFAVSSLQDVRHHIPHTCCRVHTHRYVQRSMGAGSPLRWPRPSSAAAAWPPCPGRTHTDVARTRGSWGLPPRSASCLVPRGNLAWEPLGRVLRGICLLCIFCRC